MSVDVGRMVSEGVDRTVARNGLILVALTYVLSIPSGMLGADFNRGMGNSAAMTSNAPALGLPLGAAIALWLVLVLVSTVVTVGMIRTFVGDETEELDVDDFTDNVGVVLVNLVVGGLVFGFLIGIGFVLLIVPGLFLLTSLFFWNYYVVVDDVSFIEGFQRSWELTSGERLSLFLLGVVAVVINLLINVVFGLPGLVVSGAPAFLISQVGTAVGQVFIVATGARTFVDLTGRQHETRAPSDPGHAVE